MVDCFIYTKDCSDLNGADFYHKNALKTLEQFKCDVEKMKEQLVTQEPPRQLKVVYLHWSDVCWDVDEDSAGIKDDRLDQVSEDATKNSYVDICERKDRDPGSIVRHLRRKYIIDENDKIKLLYIVTNGMINRECINECLELNKDMHYEMVVFHAFNEDPEKIDLSVGAPFFKSRCIVYRNNELCDSTDISKEFDYDKVNSDNFTAEIQQIKSYIKLKFINKFERDADVWREVKILNDLRDRMLRELTSNTPICPYFDGGLDPEKRRKLMLIFDAKKFRDYMFMAYEMKNDVQKYVAVLNNYIKSNKKSCSFDVVKFDPKVDKSVENKQFHEDDLSDDEGCQLVPISDEEYLDFLNRKKV